MFSPTDSELGKTLSNFRLLYDYEVAGRDVSLTRHPRNIVTHPRVCKSGRSHP